MMYDRVMPPTASPRGSGPQRSYRELPEDVAALARLLLDLHRDLASFAATLERHKPALDGLQASVARLRLDNAKPSPGNQLFGSLQQLLGQLREVENELAHAPETIARHGMKLQHIDLSMQLLTEMIVKLATFGAIQPLSEARLRNLRACCSRAVGTN
jgi:hypothetical protein